MRSHDDLDAILDYTEEGGTIVIRYPGPTLTPGTSVRVHEEYNVLEIGDAWYG